MPDLPQRFQKEALIQQRLNGLFRGTKKELVAHLGDPPDIANVPPDYWERMKQEARDRVANVLIIVFLLAARNLREGFGAIAGSAEIQGKARFWASRRATGEGDPGRMIDRIRGNVATFDGRAMPRTRIKALVDDVFAREDIGRLAATETTAGISAGEGAVVDLAGPELAVVAVVWEIEDSSACKLCTSLNGKSKDVWGQRFPDGPPGPHPK